MYAPSIGAPSIIKQILVDLKPQGHSSKVITYVQNSPLFSINRSFGYKTNRNIEVKMIL